MLLTICIIAFMLLTFFLYALCYSSSLYNRECERQELLKELTERGV